MHIVLVFVSVREKLNYILDITKGGVVQGRERERERAATSIEAQMLSSVVPSFYSVFPALLVDAGIWKGEPGG